MGGDGLADAVEQVLDGRVRQVHAAHALAQRVLAQCLAGDGPGVHARAAHVPVAFDNGDAFAGLGGLDRGLLARRARADDQQIPGQIACAHV